jgi:hypothetical protein
MVSVVKETLFINRYQSLLSFYPLTRGDKLDEFTSPDHLEDEHMLAFDVIGLQRARLRLVHPSRGGSDPYHPGSSDRSHHSSHHNTDSPFR